MKNKQIINLVVKGEIDINGISIKNIEGGFGENQKCLTCKDIAEIHNMEVKEINKLINNNLKEFEFGIDIIDLKTGDYKEPVLKNEILTKAEWGNSNNVYLLSEQGYFALTCLMRTDKARELRKQLRREYFRLKEENKVFKKYARSNNRFTTKCLLNLEGKKDNESDYLFLVNNAVRNEVERAIEQVGIKAGIIAVNAKIKESTLSNWRTRRQNLTEEELERIVNVIVKFKDFLD